MAQEATTGQKRGPGRPSKASQPALKKSKLSTPLDSPTTTSPTGQSPAPEKRTSKLPTNISSHRPLPTLSTPQNPSLPDSDYQTIASSAVLQTSLDRSRLKWVNEGILERYWLKPESGKNARPPKLNNPEVKWQKHKGACRIRIEPHIFEAEVYVEEKPKPVVKQYAAGPPTSSAYGQPYRPGQPQSQQGYGQQQQGQNQYFQRRTLPPIQHAQPPANTLPPLQNITPPPPSRAQPQQQEKKASPDPVISMLATRASSDPELKALMKEVATGNATQEQLKVFQGHIDELTRVISEKKKREEEEGAVEGGAAKLSASQQQGEMIQYDGPADPQPPQQQQAPRPPYQPPVYQPPPPPQSWAPPPPQPVILQFTTPGASDDRFLFPQNSILESLSPQHLLASFIVTKRPAQNPSTNSSIVDEEKELCWQPITLMVEVAYNREHILECVKKWVRPAEEVKKYMEDVMGRCVRAPETWLPLRLPLKGSAMAAAMGEGEDSSAMDEGTPTVAEGREKRGPGKSVKYVKKAAKPDTALKDSSNGDGGNGKKSAGVEVNTGSAPAASAPGQPDASPAEKKAGAASGQADENATTETGRPRRAVRKSVRISEG